MRSNLEDRDDVAAALIAAEINAGLRYVDSQTTNRPSQQPPASRLDPKKFINKNRPPVNIQQPIVKNEPPPQVGQQVNAVPVENLLVPMPEGTTIPKPTQTTGPAQMELPLNVSSSENKEPQNAPDWFRHLNRKLDNIQHTLDIKLSNIQESLKVIKQNTTKKIRRNKTTNDN